jgi:N-methylhydantoinase A
MPAGSEVSGPAIIVEDETTTIITSGFRVTMQTDGCLLVQHKTGEGNAD